MSKQPARLAAALTAAVIAFTACGGGTTPPSTEAPPADEVATESPYPGGGYVDKAKGVSSDVDAYHDSLNDALDDLP